MSLFGGDQKHYHTTNIMSNVVEKRAPTDESIAILKEMQEKTIDNIVSATTLESNGFKCGFTLLIDPSFYGYRAIVRYELNGVDYKYNHLIGRNALASCKTFKDIENEILVGLSEHIASNMLSCLSIDIFSALQGRTRG